MKRIIIVGLIIVMLVVVNGCSNGITIIKPVDAHSKIGIVQFTDCDQSKGQLNNCEGSGEKVSKVYREVFGGLVASNTDSAKFDLLIIGAVTGYNEAVPMGLRTNVSRVDIKVVDQKGTLFATQKKTAEEGNLFGSAIGCSQQLARALKSELSR